jgi:hypothetical protein
MPNLESVQSSAVEALREAGGETVLEIANKISEHFFNITREGSLLLNVHTAGCLLRKGNPRIKLAESKVELPPNINELGKIALTQINDSVQPNYDQPYVRHSFPAVSRSGLDTCMDAEERFAHALGLESNDKKLVAQKRLNELYLDNTGQAVFFKKSVYIPLSINFAPVNIGGIRYPVGTIFQVNHKRAARSVEAEALRIFSKDSITSAVPLRLSLYALAPEHRIQAAHPEEVEDFLRRDSRKFYTPALDATIIDLQQSLPAADELQEAAAILAT